MGESTSPLTSSCVIPMRQLTLVSVATYLLNKSLPITWDESRGGMASGSLFASARLPTASLPSPKEQGRRRAAVYVAAVPLTAAKGPAQMLMSAAYSMGVWDLQHFMVVVRPDASQAGDRAARKQGLAARLGGGDCRGRDDNGGRQNHDESRGKHNNDSEGRRGHRVSGAGGSNGVAGAGIMGKDEERRRQWQAMDYGRL
ncbi:hypothetical protein BHM03_00055903 [Ensete ventricosum]|nr:hypothetical protein BHM03_00055903 [Ensete ventricosum]